MHKKVAVLGATGSIGKSTLDILRNSKDRYRPVLFSAHKNHEELISLKKEFPGALAAFSGDNSALPPEIDFFGKQGLLDAIAAAGPDITVNGIAGAAGLEPSAAVLNAGSDLALANKETIVMAGNIIMDLARKKKRNIIPVDSEHFAVFKLLQAHGNDNAGEIILTASGGPFRNYSMEQLKAVTVADALAHPTWKMGPKITVDSATMANKGLEVIEAAKLFGFPPERIKVAIHPQSIVHSMIRLKDGAVYAQLSNPDMKLPIFGALCWPATENSGYGRLDFESLSLNFEKPDMEKFPMLGLAYRALQHGKHLPPVYNAANETAVEAFFKNRISFLEIPGVVEYVLDQGFLNAGECETIETALELDREARKKAEIYIESRSR